MIVAACICPLGWFAVAKLPDQFKSSAKVYVDTQSLLRPLLKGLTIQPNADHQVRLIARTLLSRPNLEKIARMADLDIAAKDELEMEKSLDELKSTLKVSSSSRSNIFNISYTSHNPNLAKGVVQAALDVFIENTMGETRNEADTAEQFLERQIKEYESRLLNDERKLTEFKQANSAILGVNVSSYYSNLEQQKNRLAEAELKLREVESQFKLARAQLEGEEPTFGLMQHRSQTTNITTKYDSRITSLKALLDELSLKYTERHPKIIEINKRIEDLEAERVKEIDRLSEEYAGYSPSSQDIDKNYVYQQMKLNVSNLQNERASLRVRVDEFKRAREVLYKKKFTSYPS